MQEHAEDDFVENGSTEGVVAEDFEACYLHLEHVEASEGCFEQYGTSGLREFVI